MQLTPMTEAEFDAYLTQLIPGYAAEHVRTGHWAADEAPRLAAAQVQGLLPQGLNTPDHYLYTLHVAGEPEAVGHLWFGVMRDSPEPRGFIYDILIHEPYRRRGYGAAAMIAIEDKARDMGLNTIALHVFGHNRAARALYSQLGYAITNVQMAKDLSANRD